MRKAKGFRRIALVGGGLSKCLLPIEDETIERWVLSISCPEALPYAARGFELHADVMDPDGHTWSDLEGEKKIKGMDNYRKILQAVQCPMYMVKEDKELCPTSVAYPFKEIVGRFGSYFDNSISYMIALAIYEGCDQLLFYGIDFMEEREHFKHAKAACEYYIGLAVGKGIDVLVAPASSLLLPVTGKLYGINQYAHELIPEWKDGWEKEQAVRQQIQDIANGIGKRTAAELGLSLEPKETQINREERIRM